LRHIVFLCVFLVASCNQPADFYDTDGKGYAYSEFAGKWQVINYWATWCAPCIKEIPELIALDNRHEDIVVFGVNFDQPDASEMAEQIKRMKITFPVYRDDPYRHFAIEAPQVLPTTVLIDPNGQVADVLVGPQTEASLLAAMGKLGNPGTSD